MLDSIETPFDLKKIPEEQLPELAREVREFLIDSISRTGGHIGANLGVIELTIALHYVFNPPEDSILFDVGHQGYTHKLLTGRKVMFPTLNTFGGMSRFISRKESDYDILDASHAGTAISIGTGIACAKMLDRSGNLVVTVVGDGSMVEGMSFEGLNFAAERGLVGLPFILVVNDNGMSIPKNVGGINNLFEGPGWEKRSAGFFEGLGFQYIAVGDGHDLPGLIRSFRDARNIVPDGVVVVHVKTEKGRGLDCAREHPYKMHFSMPFDPLTGDGSSPVPSGISYATIVGETLRESMTNDRNIVVLTPSTPYASGIEGLLTDFPGQAYDVGMAEQHCVGMAVGLALEGKKTFACFQSTFLQRAMDQVFHDMCYMGLPVTVIAARSGFSGYDSPTHHGIYDLSYLRGLPKLNIFYAGTATDLRRILRVRGESPEGPLLILHPYENIWEKGDVIFPDDDDLSMAGMAFDGRDGFIFSVGNRLPDAIRLREALGKRGVDFGLLNIRWIHPVPREQLTGIMSRVPRIVTLEENVRHAGFGSMIGEIILEEGLDVDLFVSAVEEGFVPAGDKGTLSKLTGIDSDSVLQKISRLWNI